MLATLNVALEAVVLVEPLVRERASKGSSISSRRPYSEFWSPTPASRSIQSTDISTTLRRRRRTRRGCGWGRTSAEAHVNQSVGAAAYSTTTFLRLASISGVILPLEISLRSSCWDERRCSRKLASHFPMSLTATRSRRPWTPALRSRSRVSSFP